VKEILYVDAGVSDNGNRNGKQSARICVASGDCILVDEVIGSKTNNEAEILAVAAALKWVRAEHTEIRSDSKLAVNMINRKWKGKAPNLKALVAAIKLPAGVTLTWVPREQNLAGHHLEKNYGI